MDDNRLAKIVRNGEPNILDSLQNVAEKVGHESNVNVTGGRALWMKYRTWSQKKKKKNPSLSCDAKRKRRSAGFIHRAPSAPRLPC